MSIFSFFICNFAAKNNQTAKNNYTDTIIIQWFIGIFYK